MKRIVVIAMFAVATLAICGCKEKTTEEKAQDAVKSAEKDAATAQKDLGKKLDGALGK